MLRPSGVLSTGYGGVPEDWSLSGADRSATLGSRFASVHEMNHRFPYGIDPVWAPVRTKNGDEDGEA